MPKLPKIGTVVRIDRQGTSYLALTREGKELTHGIIPFPTMKAAFETGSALVLRPTSTGGTQWRRVPMAEFKTNISTQTHTLGIENTDDIDHPSVADTRDQGDIIAFIKDAMTMKPTRLKISPLHWKFAVRAVLRGQNLLLRGESGFGKTLLAKTLPEVLGRPFFDFNMGATQDARGALIGNTHFAPDKGTFVAPSTFVKAIQTPNAVILLDELSRAHPDAHNILMTVVDPSQRYLRMDESPDTPKIKVASGVTFIATANEGHVYTATRTMDRALTDRFVVLMMEPLTVDQEMELLSEMFPALPDDTISNIARIADETRTNVLSDSPTLSTMISTRKTVELAALVSDGFTLIEAAEVAIYPFYSAAGGSESERTHIRQIVQRFIEDAPEHATPFSKKNTAATPLG